MDKDIKAAVIAALKFYGDEFNYAPDISEITGVNPATGVMEWDISNIEADEGKRARDALELIESGTPKPETKNYKVLGVVQGKKGQEFYKLGFTADIEATKEYYRIEGGWATEPSDTEPYLKFVEV